MLFKQTCNFNFNGGTSSFIISVFQFDQPVESEILMCLFTLQVSLLKLQ